MRIPRVFLQLEDDDALAHSDLRSGDAGALLGAHRFIHIGEQGLQLGAKLGDGERDLPQDRMPHFQDGSDSHEPILERDGPGEKLIGANHHLESQADAEAGAAMLIDEIARPVQAGAHFHDQPATQDSLSIRDFEAIVM